MNIETALTDLRENAPPPLAPFTNVVISPANIAAEQRRQAARLLSARERRRANKELKRLRARLGSRQARALLAVKKALEPQLAALKAEYEALSAQVAADPDNLDIQSRSESILEQFVTARTRYQHVRRQLEPYAEANRRLRELKRALEDHEMAVARQKAERQLWRAMQREAQIYERLIIDKWTRLGFAHSYSKGGKTVTEKVQFSEVSITVDAIYLKIDASYQTAFKNWKTNLPQGVYIANQLLAPQTLDELTIACQRQVTGVHSPNGAWVVVHRLDSVDGLMNYVSYGDVMERYPYQYHERFPVCVGVGNNRQVQWVNLADFPHWLVAGYTNSGKSNMVNVLLGTLISKHPPTDLRLVLIDLKGGLEFDFYDGIPHLHGKVVDKIGKVADALQELEAIMHERFKKFKGVAKRLEEYHAKRPGQYMPRIVCVFDEVASIMDSGDATKRILASLRELVRMGRAVGIHIVLATQRPDVKAIEGQIKANLAVRISGRMTTSADSVTVLGNSLAKELAAIPGRMVLQLGPDPVAIQTPHITHDNVVSCLKQAMAYPAPPALDVPADVRGTHQEWTPQRIIEFSIKHMNGLLSGRRIFDALHDPSLTASQCYQLVEQVWAMPEIIYEGQKYVVKQRVVGRNARGKYLVPVSDS